jgi:hypothetical protein
MTVIPTLKSEPRGLADFHRQFSGDFAVGATANAVGAKILACHSNPRRRDSRLLATIYPILGRRSFKNHFTS